MNRDELMREKRGSLAVDLMRLIKKINTYDNSIICVFEGEDAKYYGSRIDFIISDIERKNISCKGKGNVIRLRDNIARNAEISKAHILFFVDADFDRTPSTSNTYVTPCYSVENLYAQSIVLSKIITDELGLTHLQDDEIISAILNEYEVFQRYSDDALCELNAWIYYINTHYPDETLNLNSFKLEQFLLVKEAPPKKNYNKDDLPKIFNIKKDINDPLYQESLEVIRSSVLHERCRGKFRIECFRLFLENLFNNARDSVGHFDGKKIKPKLNLTKQNILSDLSQYAITPACLRRFLTTFITNNVNAKQKNQPAEVEMI